MNRKAIVFSSITLFAMTTLSWFGLAEQQWHLTAAIVTTVPLFFVFALLCLGQAKIYFYAALFLMPYIATTITQIMIAPNNRTLPIVCLATSLVYLMLLKFTLRALNKQLD